MKNFIKQNYMSVLFTVVSILILSITIIDIFYLRESTIKEQPVQSNYTSNEKASQENNILTNQEQALADEPIYIVKEENGIIAVFKEGESIAVMNDTVKVENLPDADKEIIKSGVEFDNYKDLIEFLENFE